MKKTISFVAAALLLLAGSTQKASAKEDCIYGFITSCGRTVYVQSDQALSDEQCADLLEALDDILC